MGAFCQPLPPVSGTWGFLGSKDQGEEVLQYLFTIPCNEVSCFIQHSAHIFHSLPSAAVVVTEALLVAIDIPGRIQFHLDFTFPNFMPGCSDYLCSSQIIHPCFHPLHVSFLF